MEFRRENFRGLLACTAYSRPSLQSIVEKTFADKLKTARFSKVFSLESFPLYSIHWNLYIKDIVGPESIVFNIIIQSVLYRRFHYLIMTQ